MRQTIIATLLLLVVLLAGCSGSALPAAKIDASSRSCQSQPNGNGPFTYVAMGASDAVGIGATCENTLAYVPLLSQKMPKGTHTINLGISGETLDRALIDELPKTVAAKPNIITIWLAANDFRSMLSSGKPTIATYAQELNTLLTILQQQTTATIYLADLPNMAKLPAIQHSVSSLDPVIQQNQLWNTTIQQITAQHHVILVDIYQEPLQANMLFIDGFHPNDLGYQLLANMFWQAIQANGGPKA